MCRIPVVLSFVLGLSVSLLAQEQPALRDPALTRALREVRVVRDADAIVVGSVVTVHPSPGIWCGVLKTVQRVTYRVEQVVAGANPGPTVEVDHLLVANSPLVAPNAPFLRPDRIAPGARLVLCLTRHDDGYEVDDEDFGVRFVDPPRTPDPTHGPLLTAVFGDAALAPWLGGSREALPVVLGGATPLPLAVTAPDRLVEFVPPELKRDRAAITIDRLSIEGDRAEVRLRIEREGVVGTFTCTRVDDRWTVVRRDVAER